MKITKNLKNRVEFHTLEQGDVFIINDMTLMKIEEIKINNIKTINAVRFPTGKLFFVSEDQYVTPAEAELIVTA